MDEIRDMMGDKPVYISFDIDALDPSIAPGTGRGHVRRNKKYLILLSAMIMIIKRLILLSVIMLSGVNCNDNYIDDDY